MQQPRIFLSNAAIIWVTQVLLLLPQLVLVPYLIDTIGEDGYGVYALVWSLLMAIEQLQRSMQSGVVKYSAGFIAQKRIDEINRVVSSSFVYSLLLAALACTVAVIASKYYGGQSEQIGPALIVTGIMAFFIYPLTPYVAVIQAGQRYYVNAIANALARYAGLLVVVIWFSMVGSSVMALIVIMAGMLFLARLVQVPIAYRLVPGLRNRFRLFDRASFRMIAVFGAVMVLASLCLVLNTTGVRWMMGALISTSFVAHLAIVLMPGAILAQIIDAMTVTVMPAASAHEATGNQEKLQSLVVSGMRYTAILVLAGTIAAMLLMRNVLGAWIGPAYEFLSPYAMVLFASQAFMLSTSVGHQILRGLGRLRTVVLVYAIGLVVVPVGSILSLLLIEVDPYRAVAAGLASGFIMCGCLQIIFCAKEVKVKLHSILWRSYAQPLLMALLASTFAIVLVAVYEIDNLLGRLAVAGFAEITFAIGFYKTFATDDERKYARLILLGIAGKIVAVRKCSTKSQR